MLKGKIVVLIVLNLLVLSAFSQDPTPQYDVLVHQPEDSLHVQKDSIKEYRNTIEAGFRYENFLENYNDRTFFYVQYGRRIQQVDLFGRVLRYTLGSIVGYQIETEAYWRFKKPGYMYFNAAYSNAEILPNYRLRAEVFQAAGKFEYSLGLGVMKPYNFNWIPLITGTVGYYFGDYYIYARPTFSYVDNGFAKSLFIQGRQYFSKTDFVAFSLLKGADTGTSRDISSVANQFGNDTYLIRLNGQFKTGRYKLGAGLDYGGIYIPERTEYARFIGLDIFINREF